MRKEELQRYILDNQESFFKLEVFLRDLSIDYHTVKNLNKIVTISGAGRVGKTSFLRQVAGELSLEREEILFLDFSESVLTDFSVEEFEYLFIWYKELFPSKNPIFFLDEIQEVKNFEKGLRYLQNRRIPLFITGSSSHLFSRDIASILRGKTLNYELFPLNLKEYLVFNDFTLKPVYKTEDKATLSRHLTDFFLWGGFPEVVLAQKKVSKKHLLKSYIDIMLLRDVIEKNGIQNVTLIDDLFKKSARSFTKNISVHKWYNDLKSRGFRISKDTLYLYLHYLEETGFLSFIEPLGKDRGVSKKVFLLDNGLYTVLKGFEEDRGKLLENRVFCDLRRKGAFIKYFKSPLGEIDFITEDALIQVCLELTEENRRREEKGFEAIAKRESKNRQLIIVTLEESKVDAIVPHMNYYQFALSDRAG